MRFTDRNQAHEFYADVLSGAEKRGEAHLAMADLGRRDLFFLLVRLCGRTDIDRDWLFDRCREVQQDPDGYLDLWAREHYKSTLITFGKTVQDVLNDPNITVGIFSHTRPIAKAFLRQIKFELEANELLKSVYPDVLWENPRSESPKWSEDAGLIVKRTGNPKEATIEAWGLVDGQPTSKHYSLLIYDDVVTRESVTTPEMIEKTTAAWELSLNLGAEGGRRRAIGTRYHFNDTYRTMISRGSVTPRIYPATDDGTVEGPPVLFAPETLAQKRRDMGPYTFACQMLQDPKADEVQGFKQDWLRYWKPVSWRGMNLYLLCDPANEKKKTNDYTVMWVIGLGADENYYAIDGLRDRLSLTQRAEALFHFHQAYRPVEVGYEKYGMQADIEHFQDVMERKNYRFNIIELGGPTPKLDRIRKLIPIFEQGRMYLPQTLFKTDYQGQKHNLTAAFVDEEYMPFPVAVHDDMLDAMARVLDPELGAKFPKIGGVADWRKRRRPGGMAA